MLFCLLLLVSFLLVMLSPPIVMSGSVMKAVHAVVLFAAAVMVTSAPMPCLAVNHDSTITNLLETPGLDYTTAHVDQASAHRIGY